MAFPFLRRVRGRRKRFEEGWEQIEETSTEEWNERMMK